MFAGIWWMIAMALAAEPTRTEQGCEAGKVEDCMVLIETYQASHDWYSLRPILTRTCELGVAEACVFLGWKLVARSGSLESMAQAFNEARELFAEACDLGLASGCSAAGVMTLESTNSRGKAQDAVALFEVGCEGGDTMGCRLLGDMYYRGSGVEQDRQRAGELYRSICEAGSRLGCTQYALMVGAGIMHDDMPEAALLRRACGLGENGACGLLALDAVARGEPDAPQELKNACNSGSAVACGALGHAYASGLLDSQKPMYGIALLEKACDPDKGVDCRRPGCEREFPLACRWLGYHTWHGNGIKASKATARRLYKAACDAGDPMACRSPSHQDYSADQMRAASAKHSPGGASSPAPSTD